ncbi:MAG: hypothetical protein DWQ04_18110 [Chloroflexi bacterium]|nr:MAG: hypothetical protein DWQ04_18110 [Chloroflexota bacterium]
MTEKVIQEVRIIETDEGYRIEINGDKEKLRQMGFSPERMFRRGMGFGMMGKRKHGGHGHHRHGHRRRRMRGHFGPGFMPPWMWHSWGDEVDENDEQDVPEHKAHA